MTTAYRDEQLTIDDAGITIRDYYFPRATPRTIPWDRIRAVRAFDLTVWNGKYRIWGMGLRPNWFGCDTGRPRKSTGFILDTGSIIKAAITPADPARVRAILAGRGLLP